MLLAYRSAGRGIPCALADRPPLNLEGGVLVSTNGNGVGMKLQALDSDLPLLASRAAIQLDDLILKKRTKTDAIQQLAEYLANSTKEVNGSGVRQSLMDPSTAEVLRRALEDSRGQGEFKTIGELVHEAWLMAEGMRHPDASRDTDEERPSLDRLKRFCVALSRQASSFRQSVYDVRPAHRFRK
jgi:hypothetical protein